MFIPSSTTVTIADVAPGAANATRISAPDSDAPNKASLRSTETGTSSSAGRTAIVASPCARTARCFAFASTLCTTETKTSRFGAFSAVTGRSTISLVAFVSARISVYASFSRSTETSAQPAKGARTLRRGVSPTR